MHSMRIPELRKYLETAVLLKTQVESMQWKLGLIEDQLRDILSSDDFETLPEDVQTELVVPRVRAIRYWRIQLDDYIDSYLISLINPVKKSTAKQLDITLDQAKDYFEAPLNEPIIDSPAEAFEVTSKEVVITEAPAENLEEILQAPEEKKSKTDDDILKELMAAQDS